MYSKCDPPWTHADDCNCAEKMADDAEDYRETLLDYREGYRDYQSDNSATDSQVF